MEKRVVDQDEIHEQHREVARQMWELNQSIAKLQAELLPLQKAFDRAWKTKLKLESQMETMTLVPMAVSAATKAGYGQPAKMKTSADLLELMKRMPVEQQKAFLTELIRLKGE